MRGSLAALAALTALAGAAVAQPIPQPPQRPGALPAPAAPALAVDPTIRFPRRAPAPTTPPAEHELIPQRPADGPPTELSALAGIAREERPRIPRALPTIVHGHRSVADTTCLPDSVLRILADVSSRFGPVNVTSTVRDRGRRNSMHRFCRAADFRVEGIASGTVVRYLRTRGDAGGLKVYRNGLIHVDDSLVRSW